jgi:hypothetical protein
MSRAARRRNAGGGGFSGFTRGEVQTRSGVTMIRKDEAVRKISGRVRRWLDEFRRRTGRLVGNDMAADWRLHPAPVPLPQRRPRG